MPSGLPSAFSLNRWLTTVSLFALAQITHPTKGVPSCVGLAISSHRVWTGRKLRLVHSLGGLGTGVHLGLEHSLLDHQFSVLTEISLGSQC